MSRRKHNRVIEQLRREFPDLTWRAEHQGGGVWHWMSSAGWYVYGVSTCSISEGGVESYDSHLERSDTHARIWGLPLF